MTATSLESLRTRPNALAPHYRRFRVAERLLLTGHSHQAWPDRALAGQVRAFDDAAEHVDGKWSRAFAQAEQVGRHYASYLGDRTGSVAVGANTHELLVRFLSALDWRRRPRLVATDGEYHSLRRQLARLAEEGFEVVTLAADDPSTLAERLAAAVDDRTACVFVSSVLFRSGRIVPGLDRVAAAAARHGAEILVDVYHQLGVVPCDLAANGLDAAFCVGGGYKYCQLGEGNGFLRVPPGRNLRPAITGWFAEFATMTAPPQGGVGYGPGAAAFGGATYDPTSNYRAVEVIAFFAEQGLEPTFLRQVSQHQVGRLAHGFDQLDLDPGIIRRPPAAIEELGGFLTLEAPHAAAISQALHDRGVDTDYRGSALRLGPAPYLDDQQLDAALAALGDACRTF
jgi:kynureninase